MLTNNELKYYSSLTNKKYRKQENKFIVEGKRLVSELLNSNYEIEVVVYTEKFAAANHDFLKQAGSSNIRLETASEKEFKKLCDTKTPQGVLAAVKYIANSDKILSSDLIVALENISDPGNLGTILRNCDWFGVETVILSEECAEVFNPKVLRSSMGAAFHLNIIETDNFIELLGKQSKGYKIITADMNGDNLFEKKLESNSILVFCNEANGPSTELLNITDSKLTIPKIGNVESLNVASASAVILAELTR